MNENAAIAAIAAAWTTVQVTRMGLNYRAAQRRADRDAKTNAAKETTS